MSLAVLQLKCISFKGCNSLCRFIIPIAKHFSAGPNRIHNLTQMWNFMSCTQLQERLPPQKIGRKNNNYNCICSSPQRLPGAIECSVGPHPLQNFKPERNNWKQIAYSVSSFTAQNWIVHTYGSKWHVNPI